MPITIRTVEEGISVDRQHLCSECKTDTLVIVLDNGFPETLCSICGHREDLVDQNKLLAKYLLPAAIKLRKKYEEEIETLEERLQEYGDGQDCQDEIETKKGHFCITCGEAWLEGKDWSCPDCLATPKKSKDGHYCIRCGKNKIKGRDRICKVCKRA